MARVIIPEDTTLKYVNVVYSTFRGKMRTVTNLGWLLRHWKEVEYFEIREPTEEKKKEHWHGFMIAYLRGGGWYETDWADLGVCRDWLKRPVFRGCRLIWLGEETTC